MKQPFISIGIPIYNAEKFLDCAISSVLAQTYQKWELILIDDGSTDDSLKIARKYEAIDNRIRVLSDGLNKKLPARLNQLIDESKYNYIARMDADDIMHPDRLRTQISFLENNLNYDLVSTGIISIDSKNSIKGFRSVNKLTENVNIHTGFPITHPSIMARKEWYKRHYYSELVPRSEDYELWCRSSIGNDFKIAILPDLLLFYREEGNLSVDKITSSYKDGLKVKLTYTNTNKTLQRSKVYLKSFLVQLLFKLHIESLLASRRNQKLPRNQLLKYENVLKNSLKFIQ